MMLQIIFGKIDYPTTRPETLEKTELVKSRLHPCFETVSFRLSSTMEAVQKRKATLEILKPECTVCTRDMPPLHAKNVVVTGATIGLGLEAAWM